MRKFLIAVVFLLGVIFVITRLAEVKEIVDTLKRGDIRYILLALAVQAIWLLNIAASYQAIYRTLCIEEKLSSLFFMAAGANFANVVAPTAGMSGVAVFATEAKRRGYSPALATLTGVLFVLFDYAGFLCILAVGLIILLRRNNITSTEIIASGIFVILASAITALLFLGLRSAEALGNVLTWLANHINRGLHPFIHHPYLSEVRAMEFAHDAAQGLTEIRRNPRNLVLPLILALSSKTLLIIVLYLVFLAFKVPASVGTLIAGFSISYLFLIISPTPSGLGIVEGVLTLVLSSMYISLGAAAVITIAYRGITFWLPLLLGAIALRFLHSD